MTTYKLNINHLNLFLFFIYLINGITLELIPPMNGGHYPDTYDYLHQATFPILSSDLYFPEVSKDLYPKPFIIPLIYKAFGENFSAIMIMQVVLQALSILFTVYAFLSYFSGKIVKFIYILLIYILLSSWYIFGWNTILLSESITISLLLIWVSSLFLYNQNRNKKTFTALCLSTILFGLSRDTWPIILLGFFTVHLVYSLIKSKSQLRPVALLLLISSFLFIFQAKSAAIGNRHKLPVINNLALRVLPNSEYLNWFVKEGMPDAELLKEHYGHVKKQTNLYDLYRDSRFNKLFNWVEKHGATTYLKFQLTHPSQLFLFNEKWDEVIIHLKFSNEYFHEPRGLSKYFQVIVPNIHLVISLILFAFAVIILIINKKGVLCFLLVTMLLFTYANTLICYNGDAVEYSRHLIHSKVLIQILSLFSMLIIIDNFQEVRALIIKHSE